MSAPLTTTAELSWRWEALHDARTCTTEDDMLRELFGQRGEKHRTQRPWLRVDIVLCAALPWGKALPMPSPTVMRDWFEGTTARLEPIVPEERVRVPRGKNKLPELAWAGEPGIEATCTPDGYLELTAIELSAWQAIHPPRTWSDPDRRGDSAPHAELRAMFERARAALLAFAETVDHLQPRARGGRR